MIYRSSKPRWRLRDLGAPLLAIDVTEFLHNPIRTGIQRVVREILTHWPEEIAKEIVCFEPSAGTFIRVEPEVVAYCIEQSGNPYLSVAEAANVIAASLATSVDRIVLQRGDRVLVPELFVAFERIQFYEQIHRAGVELFPVVYDFLAWTSPDALNIPYVGGLNDYLGFLLRAKRRSFISRSVHDVFYTRLLRKPAGDDQIMPLGADAMRRQPGNQGKRSTPYFVCAGALDGRKGQDAVLRAFLASTANELCDLIFAGKIPSAPRREMVALIASTHPRVKLIDDPDDLELALLIQGAQASFFISRNEGFGLPAVESLYLGTPVVVAVELPAISHLGPYGQIRLQGESEAELVEAMNRLVQPNEAGKLKSEIPRLNLQTWASYAKSIANWASS